MWQVSDACGMGIRLVVLPFFSVVMELKLLNCHVAIIVMMYERLTDWRAGHSITRKVSSSACQRALQRSSTSRRRKAVRWRATLKSTKLEEISTLHLARASSNTMSMVWLTKGTEWDYANRCQVKTSQCDITQVHVRSEWSDVVLGQPWISR